MTEIVSESDLARLRTVLRHLETISEALPDDLGLSLGNAALSDTKDWLDCFIERLVAAISRPSSQPLMGGTHRDAKPSIEQVEALIEGGIIHAIIQSAPAKWRAVLDDVSLASLPAQGGEPVACRWRLPGEQEEHEPTPWTYGTVAQAHGMTNPAAWEIQPLFTHPAPEQGWRAPRAAFVMEAKDGTGWRVQAGYERKEDAHLVADILSGCKPEQEAV